MILLDLQPFLKILLSIFCFFHNSLSQYASTASACFDSVIPICMWRSNIVTKIPSAILVISGEQSALIQHNAEGELDETALCMTFLMGEEEHASSCLCLRCGREVVLWQSILCWSHFLQTLNHGQRAGCEMCNSSGKKRRVTWRRMGSRSKERFSIKTYTEWGRHTEAVASRAVCKKMTKAAFIVYPSTCAQGWNKSIYDAEN